MRGYLLLPATLALLAGSVGCGGKPAPAVAPGTSPQTAGSPLSSLLPSTKVTKEQMLALRSKDQATRDSTIRNWGVDAAVPAMREAMVSTDPEIRLDMSQWLVLMGPKGADALTDSLKDPSPDVRYQGALALTLGIEDGSGGAMLVEGANVKDWPAVLAVLIEAAKDQNPAHVVRMYAQVTEEINGVRKTSVVPTSVPVGKQAFRAIPAVGSYGWKIKGIAPALIPLLQSENPEVRLTGSRAVMSLVGSFLIQLETPNQFPPTIDPKRSSGAVFEDIKLAMQTLRATAASTDPAVAEAIATFLAKNEPKWQATAQVVPELK